MSDPVAPVEVDEASESGDAATLQACSGSATAADEGGCQTAQTEDPNQNQPLNQDVNNQAHSQKEESAAEELEEAEEVAEDQFEWILRCERKQENHFVFRWLSPRPPTQHSNEEKLLQSKLLRYGKKERGMMKTQPDWRKDEFRRICERSRVPLLQALSLRRHHMKQLNLNMRMSALGLGKEEHIREAAQIFEECVSHFLISQKIGFYSEDEQKKHIQANQNGRPHPPTPDFLLREEIVVETFHRNSNRRKRARSNGNNKQHQQEKSDNNNNAVVVQRRKVCWIDAKMFYGASTIQYDNKSAVGCLLATARKYNNIFGPGAFVFMYGYGDRLARDLGREGAMCLDCSGEEMFSLQPVQEHQRTWCADASGRFGHE